MVTWVEKLVGEYSKEIRRLEGYQKTLDLKSIKEDMEHDTVSGMLADMRFAVTWMRQGRRPGSVRGIEHRDIYRERALFAELHVLDPNITPKLVKSLLALSSRERECFLLHMAYGLTQLEISDILNLSRSAVQSYISRAKRKVEIVFS